MTDMQDDSGDLLPPRMRTRRGTAVSLSDQDQAILDLSETVLVGRLPKMLSQKIRTLALRSSPELMPVIYDSMFKLRMAGVLIDDIADMFQVSPRTIKTWWKKAKEYVSDKYTNLDPAYLYSERMNQYDVMRERISAMLLATENVDVTAKLSNELMKINETERRWLDSHGYFNLFNVGRFSGEGSDSAEAKADRVRKILVDAFDDIDDEYEESSGDQTEEKG